MRLAWLLLFVPLGAFATTYNVYVRVDLTNGKSITLKGCKEDTHAPKTSPYRVGAKAVYIARYYPGSNCPVGKHKYEFTYLGVFATHCVFWVFDMEIAER